MADTTVASVITVLPPYKGSPTATARPGSASSQTEVATSAPHVEQARLIGTENSISSIIRQADIAKSNGIALYQTVQEASTPEGVSQGPEQKSDSFSGYRPVNLFA